MPNEFSPFALVVDDDVLIRMDIVTILEDAGFRTHEAGSVDQAVALLEQTADSIRLLFSDVHMPPSERTGFELASLCAERWSHISIIVASGAADPGDAILPRNARFIRKPFSSEMVHEHLLEMLPDGAKPKPLKQRAE